MSAERFPVAVDSITIPGQTDAACKKGEDFNAHINTICNDIHKFYGMKIVTHAPAQRPARRSARRRSNRNATVDDQTAVITFCVQTRRRIVSAPIRSVLQAGTVAQRFGRDQLVAVLHLLSNPSCRREVGASWTDVAVTLVAGIGGPAAEVAGFVARPLPLGEIARVATMVAQLGCDRGWHQHVPLRVQSVPVNRLSEVSMSLWIRLCNHTYIHTYIRMIAWEWCYRVVFFRSCALRHACTSFSF